MTVYVVWSLKEGVISPPRPLTIPDEVLEHEESERKRQEEVRAAERFVA